MRKSTLEHIAQLLDDPQWQLAQLVQRHLADISRRVELALALQSRLDDQFQGVPVRRGAR